MTRNVATCGEDDSVASIMERMTAGKFRHMPVIAKGELVGLISIGDVVKQRVERDRERVRGDARLYPHRVAADLERLPLAGCDSAVTASLTASMRFFGGLGADLRSLRRRDGNRTSRCRRAAG